MQNSFRIEIILRFRKDILTKFCLHCYILYIVRVDVLRNYGIMMHYLCFFKRIIRGKFLRMVKYARKLLKGISIFYRHSALISGKELPGKTFSLF